MIGRYENEFAPLGPQVITVTGVEMVSWTWPVSQSIILRKRLFTILSL